MTQILTVSAYIKFAWHKSCRQSFTYISGVKYLWCKQFTVRYLLNFHDVMNCQELFSHRIFLVYFYFFWHLMKNFSSGEDDIKKVHGQQHRL